MDRDKLLGDIKEYCKVNSIEDVEGFMDGLLNDAFMRTKWGQFIPNKNEQTKSEDVAEPVEVKVSQETEKVVKTNKSKDIYGE